MSPVAGSVHPPRRAWIWIVAALLLLVPGGKVATENSPASAFAPTAQQTGGLTPRPVDELLYVLVRGRVNKYADEPRGRLVVQVGSDDPDMVGRLRHEYDVRADPKLDSARRAEWYAFMMENKSERINVWGYLYAASPRPILEAIHWERRRYPGNDYLRVRELAGNLLSDSPGQSPSSVTVNHRGLGNRPLQFGLELALSPSHRRIRLRWAQARVRETGEPRVWLKLRGSYVAE